MYYTTWYVYALILCIFVHVYVNAGCVYTKISVAHESLVTKSKVSTAPATQGTLQLFTINHIY